MVMKGHSICPWVYSHKKGYLKFLNHLKDLKKDKYTLMLKDIHGYTFQFVMQVKELIQAEILNYNF